MFWAILIAFGLVALVVVGVFMLIGGVLSAIGTVLFAPDREASSPAATLSLAIAGIASLFGGAALNTVAPGAFLIPLLAWLVALALVRNSAPLKETEEQRRAREAAARKRAKEEVKREAARKAVAARQHADSLTKDGLKLLERARCAIADVKSTEAAREGWLGEWNDLNFPHDVAVISDTLQQARRIEKVVERTKKLPDPTPDDKKMLREAEQKVKTLRADSKARVQLLEDCAKQAREIDRLLEEERRRLRLDKQRDEARRQLATELFLVEVTPVQRESDAADAIAARVAAFKELKNIVDEPLRREIEGAGAGPVQEAMTWVRRAIPFWSA